jgi:hypothetical protein
MGKKTRGTLRRQGARKGKGASGVVDLAMAREEREIRDSRFRVHKVVESNRRALSRLFESGLVFTRAGARACRDLLLAHLYLLKVQDLFARIDALEAEAGKKKRPSREAVKMYLELQGLLEKTSQLTARGDGLLARRG